MWRLYYLIQGLEDSARGITNSMERDRARQTAEPESLVTCDVNVNALKLHAKCIAYSGSQSAASRFVMLII